MPLGHQHPNIGQQTSITHNGMVDAITPDIEQAIADTAAAGNMLQLRTLGGAIQDVPADATAFGNRHQSTLIAGTAWDRTSLPLLDRYWATRAPSFTGAYGNFESTPTPASVGLAFPDHTRLRLEELKARYDPDRTFSTWPE